MSTFAIDGDIEWMQGFACEAHLYPQKRPHDWPFDPRVIVCYGDVEEHQAMVNDRNAAIRKAWADDTLKQEQSDRIKAAYAARSSADSAVHRSRQSTSIRKAYEDPDLRKRVSEAKKVWWAARKQAQAQTPNK